MNEYMDIFLNENNYFLEKYYKDILEIKSDFFKKYCFSNVSELEKLITQKNKAIDNKKVKITVEEDIDFNDYNKSFYVFSIILKDSNNNNQITISYNLNDNYEINLEKIGFYDKRKDKSLELKQNKVRFAAINKEKKGAYETVEVLEFAFEKETWIATQSNYSNQIEVDSFNFCKQYSKKVCDNLILKHNNLEHELELFYLEKDKKVNLDLFRSKLFNINIEKDLINKEVKKRGIKR